MDYKTIPSNLIKLTFVLLFALTGILISCSTEKVKNKQKETDSKSVVKSIRETEFKALDKFGELQKGDLQSVTITLFDNNGNKLERSYYYPNGSLKEKGIYRYNSENILIGVDAYGQSGSLKYHYIIVKIDEQGNPTHTYEVNLNQDTVYKYVDRYDDIGNIIEFCCYGSDGTFLGRNYYKYDDKKNKIEDLDYDSDGKLISSKTFKYEKYDKNGNWIIQINTGTEPSITEREIEYYE